MSKTVPVPARLVVRHANLRPKLTPLYTDCKVYWSSRSIHLCILYNVQICVASSETTKQLYDIRNVSSLPRAFVAVVSTPSTLYRAFEALRARKAIGLAQDSGEPAMGRRQRTAIFVPASRCVFLKNIECCGHARSRSLWPNNSISATMFVAPSAVSHMLTLVLP